MNENLIPGLQRALEIFHEYGVGDTHFIYVHIQREIEKEKAKEESRLASQAVDWNSIQAAREELQSGGGKVFDVSEANQESNPTNTIFGCLANKPPLDTKLPL